MFFVDLTVNVYICIQKLAWLPLDSNTFPFCKYYSKNKKQQNPLFCRSYLRHMQLHCISNEHYLTKEHSKTLPFDWACPEDKTIRHLMDLQMDSPKHCADMFINKGMHMYMCMNEYKELHMYTCAYTYNLIDLINFRGSLHGIWWCLIRVQKHIDDLAGGQSIKWVQILIFL